MAKTDIAKYQVGAENGTQDASANSLPIYATVNIQTFRDATRDIPFDVYLKLSEDNYAHIFSRTTGIDYKRLAQYAQKGVTDLYIRKEDEAAYQSFISRTAEVILRDPEISNERKIATLLNMTEQNMSELFVQLNVPEETAAQTEKVIKNYISMLAESPKSLSILLRLASHGDYLYYHSIAVAIFSLIVAKATGVFNQRTLELVSMGGFMHDIGCTQIAKGLLCSKSQLNAAQWKEMRSHTKLGLQMIENTPNIPDEVRYIVYQHHEEPSGAGYPNGLKGSAIYYPAKVVALADCFSALISQRAYRAAYTVEEAIHILQAESTKYDRDLVRVLATVFLRNMHEAKNAA